MRGSDSNNSEPNRTSVGTWRLLRLVGEGQWCQVYQAMPSAAAEGSAADYAVKLLRPSREQDRQARALLRQEALVAGQVTHPHLVCVLSAHVERSPCYLVMPFQEGISLREYLRRFHPLPPANCLWIARQVAEGLAALGEKGWAHCDVKPENIQVARNGHATLCDLGLARRLTPGQKGDAALVGTPAYMAPESFTPGEARTPAADSYGLGIVLFELLAGRRPFPHTDAEELMAAHRMVRAPDPRTIRPDLPARIAQLVRSLLAKEPMRRPTGRELITALVDAEIDLFEQRRVA